MIGSACLGASTLEDDAHSELGLDWWGLGWDDELYVPTQSERNRAIHSIAMYRRARLNQDKLREYRLSARLNRIMDVGGSEVECDD